MGGGESYAGIPSWLRDGGRFCCWQWEKRDDNWTKVPCSPLTGQHMDPTDPGCYTGLETARAASERYAGIGVGILGATCGIDLDHCITPEGAFTGDVHGEVASAVLELMDGCYVERSPSGNGLHLLFRSSISESFESPEAFKALYYINRSQSIGLEVYPAGVTGKFLTLTGACVREETVGGDRTEGLLAVLDRYMRRPTPEAAPAREAEPLDMTDAELLDRARAARNGAKFSALFDTDGGWRAHYPSRSEADLALCGMLAFWAQRDPERIDRLFRASRLYRSKWEREDYRNGTIAEAVSGCREVYSPGDGATATASIVPDAAQPVTEPKAAPYFWHHKRNKDGEVTSSKFDFEAMADYLMAERHACLSHGATPSIWSPEDGRWLLGADVWERAVVRLASGTTIRHRREVADLIRLRCGTMETGGHSHLIACRNGVIDPLDSRLGQPDGHGGLLGVRPNDPALGITNVLPVDYDPTAYDGRLYDFLNDLAGGDGLVLQNLVEVMAASIYRGREIQQAAFLCGPGGTGKSTFIRLLQRFVGRENYAVLKLHSMGARFGLTPVVGKTCVIGDDVKRGRVGDEALSTFRTLTSHDELLIESKGKDLFAYQPFGAMIFSCNEFPALDEVSVAELDRIHCIPLTTRFRGTEGCNPAILDQFDNDASRSFMLNLALEALPIMLRSRGYSETQFSRFMHADIQGTSDPVAFFIDETGRDSKELEGVAVADLYQQFVGFCESAGIAPIRRPNRKRFSQGVNTILGMATENNGYDAARGEKRRIFTRV